MTNNFDRGSTDAVISAADQYASSNGLPTSGQYSSANTGIRGSHILDVGLFTASNGSAEGVLGDRRDFINEIYDGQNHVFDVAEIEKQFLMASGRRTGVTS